MGWSIGTGVGPVRYSIPLGGKHHMRRGVQNGSRAAVGLFTGVLVVAAQFGLAALAMVWAAILVVAAIVRRLIL